MALLFAVAAVALGACGGNDDDSASKASAERGATGEQSATTPRTGASGASGTKRARPKRTDESEQRSAKKTRPSEGKTGSPAPAPATAEKEKRKPQPRTLTPEELKQVAPNYYEQARELCKASTLEELAKYYGIKSGDADEVAEAYAAEYLAGLREAVKAGCKAGLLESK
jgi:hypothetical protein